MKKKKQTLLIPAMLDAHFPLMKYAFLTPEYNPVILSQGTEVLPVGLRYTHNDMCWPLAMMTGQMIDALRSGKYDTARTKLLMPTVGDACRGSNYTELLRKAVKKAGFPETQILNLNLKHIDTENLLPVTPVMVWRALFSLFYGDLLLLLVQQVRPYEKRKGDTERLRDRWFSILGEELRERRNMSLNILTKRFRSITDSFRRIPRRDVKKQRIAVVGELYTKYCSVGNWDIVRFLEDNGCESFTNGLSWYVIYYIDAQLVKLPEAAALGYRAVGHVLERLQKSMVKALTEAGFYSLPPLHTLKAEAEGIVSTGGSVGDGWLIGVEAAGYFHHGCPKVLAVQPFGCMPSHIFGRGIYSSVARKCGGQIVSIDIDSSGTPLNSYNRARMLIDS